MNRLKTIAVKTLKQKLFELDLSGFSSGIYFFVCSGKTKKRLNNEQKPRIKHEVCVKFSQDLFY